MKKKENKEKENKEEKEQIHSHTLNSINDLIDESKKAKHKYFKIYSKKDNINKIITNKNLRFSNGVCNWNDLTDIIHFNNSQKKVYRFGLCFSTYQSESVAMWMLYGGKGKNGAMIDFRKTAIDKIIDNTIGNEVTIKCKCDDKIIKRARIKDMYLCDAIYCSKGFNYLLCNNTGYINKGKFSEKEIINKTIVTKPYQWRYEKETRLIIEIDNKDILKKYRNIGLYIDVGINDIIDCQEYKVFSSPLGVYDGFQPSELEGTIKWDLDS